MRTETGFRITREPRQKRGQKAHLKVAQDLTEQCYVIKEDM